MNAVNDFDAVMWNGDCWCVSCLPGHIVDLCDQKERISPIWKDEDWEGPAPSCWKCKEVHTYMSPFNQMEF